MKRAKEKTKLILRLKGEEKYDPDILGIMEWPEFGAKRERWEKKSAF